MRLSLALVLGLLGMAWSGQSLAQSCDFVAIGSVDEIGLPGTNVSFTLEAQTACSPTVNITLAVTGADTTGGATIVPPANPTITLDTPYTFTVTLGPNPGGNGTVTATCLGGGCAGDTLTFTFRTNNDFDYTPVGPTTVVTNQITPFTIGTNLLLNGAPAGLATNYLDAGTGALIANAPADGAGNTSLTQTVATAGTLNYIGAVACPTAFVLEGCAAVPPINYTIQVEPVALTAQTPLAPTTASGVPLTLTTRYGSASIPAPDGTVITWTITGQPGGGDGAITATTTAAGLSDATFTATVPGNYTVFANSGCTFCAPGNQTFTITVTAIPIVVLPVTSDPHVGVVGTGTFARVRVEQGGTPLAGVAVQWTATAPFTPASASTTTNGSGNTGVNFTPSAAGNFPGAITAVHDPDGVPANGDEVSYVFDAIVTATPPPTLTPQSANPATGGVGTAMDFSVRLEAAGTPLSGETVVWTATAPFAPSGASTTTDAAGDATASFTPSATGNFTGAVTALHDPDGITGNGDEVTYVFDAIVSATAPPILTPQSADPATAQAGDTVDFTVRLELAGAPVPGAAIQWTAIAPLAPASASSTTDAAGDASASFATSTAGSFANAVTASHDPDGIPGNGDEVSYSFDLVVSSVPSLSAVSGDGQSALPGEAFALPLVVLAENSGVPAVGVPMEWTVDGADGSVLTVAPSGPTDASGQAQATVTAGAQAGVFVVHARRLDSTGSGVGFTLTVTALGTLSIVSGDGQSLVVGVDSAPLEVELKDAGGTPIPGATINWTTTDGTLADASTVTDASGRSSTTIVADAAGSIQVTATTNFAESPAVFSLNGSLEAIPGLTAEQRGVAQAIDQACPALAALPSPTPGQLDLLQRCRELAASSGVDPAATAQALDQMMANVALAQANAGFSAAQSQFQNLKTRIAALRSGTGGTSFGGLALNTPSGPVSLGLLAAALNGEESVAEIGTDFSRWGFFAAGTIGRGEADEGEIDPAYDYDIEGLTAGFDYRWNDKWIFGGALGMTRQDTDLPDGRGGLETSGWSVSGYTTYYQQDSWYLDGVVTWGRNDYEMLRRIQYTLPQPGGTTVSIDQQARSDSQGDLMSGAFTLGRDFNRGAWGLGPYARLLYTRLTFDAIEERLEAGAGSGLGLYIEERELDSIASVLGGKLTYTASTEWGVLMPHLQLEWEHEFRDDPQALEARFINDPSGTAMVLNGDPLDTDYFRLGLGMSMVLTKGRSGFFYYERLVGKNGTSQYNLALGFRMEF